MKTKISLQIIVLYMTVIVISSKASLGQSMFQLENISVENLYFFPNLKDKKISSFSSWDSKIIFENERGSRQVEFYKDRHSTSTGINVLVGIKKRGREKPQSAFQSFSIGLGYRSVIKNAIEFYQEKPKGGTSFDNPWLNVFFGSSSTSNRATTYEAQSSVFSVQIQEMFWILNSEQINFGMGLKADFGFEFNSKLIQKNYSEGNTRSLWSSNSYSNLISTIEHKSENEIIFSGSIPMTLRVRFSDNKKKLANKIKLVTSFLVGFQENIFSSNNNATFISSGFGLQYDI